MDASHLHLLHHVLRGRDIPPPGRTYCTDAPVRRGCSAADRNAGCALLLPNPHITMEASGITMPEDNEASIKARRISHIMRQVRKRATVSSADTRLEFGETKTQFSKLDL